jgi:hypothetical protein
MPYRVAEFQPCILVVFLRRRLFVDRIVAAIDVDRLELYHHAWGGSYHVNL